ncbi:MAG TPA: cation-translocating P-type ATPase [Chitinophagaceae bacterium]|nr:cation-translocating P-type ATPase [Chitinophagaceae bacterium]
MNWHSLDIQQVFQQTNSSEKGLSASAAAERLQEHGPNELVEKAKKSPLIIFLGQFKDFMILVLIAAAVVSGFVGDISDTIIIFVIVLLNAIVGFVQEYRAEKSMEALKKMAALQSQVIRDDKTITIDATGLVPGDLIVMEAGNVIPADVRLVETHSFRVNESALTGESVPVDKIDARIDTEELPLGDRLNMGYKSTLITNGRAKAVVIATGMNTEIGRIAGMLQTGESITPLQKRMADFSRKLSYLVLLICVILFAAGILRGEPAYKMLLLSISLAVAAIPEALPALITVCLSLGARRMVKKNALIRKLPAVETLGSVNFICSDKTGTLTLNKMKVVEEGLNESDQFTYDNKPALHIALALNHDVKKSAEGELVGDPTEIALAEYFVEKYGEAEIENLRNQLPRIGEIPFDSDRKMMTTAHQLDNKVLLVTKGAIESISNSLADRSTANELSKKADKWAADGIRVMAFSYKTMDQIPSPFTEEVAEKDLQFAGLAGLIDPPREEAKLAIAECKTAGINTVMITGDHLATASSIASQLGILTKKDLAVSGIDLKAMTDEEFLEKVENIRVYARVSPDQKLKIVQALQQKGYFVSMTGDGVNDAPSLKVANIGVAMGITGTDVSKEAAHMILLDDNFATIVKAVKEGRRIYDNIRKFIKYIMTCNGAEIWIMVLAPLIGLPIPLLPIHILWINLVTDGLPGLALAGEKAEADIMKRPPRKANESLFAEGIGFHIAWVGILMAGVTLGVQSWAIHNDRSAWQTMVFAGLSFSQLGHIMAIKSERQPLLGKNFFSNIPLLVTVAFTFLLQLAVIYLPFANTLLKTQPLTINELLVCLASSFVVVTGVEIEKLIRRRKNTA